MILDDFQKSSKIMIFIMFQLMHVHIHVHVHVHVHMHVHVFLVIPSEESASHPSLSARENAPSF